MADDKKLKSSVDNFLKKDLTYKIRSLKGIVFSGENPSLRLIKLL